MSSSPPELPGGRPEDALRPGSDGEPSCSEASTVPAESDSDSSPSEAEGAESEWARRRRLAAVFGDVLPEQTGDDTAPRSGKGDDWYRDQVPPHHGG